MNPFNTLNNYTLEAFAERTDGPFNFLEYGVRGTSQATLRANKSRTIRVTAFRIAVNDLQDQTNLRGARPELHCFECGESYSANRGDYFMCRPDRVFRCCGRPMALVVRSEAFTEVG